MASFSLTLSQLSYGGDCILLLVVYHIEFEDMPWVAEELSGRTTKSHLSDDLSRVLLTPLALHYAVTNYLQPSFYDAGGRLRHNTAVRQTRRALGIGKFKIMLKSMINKLYLLIVYRCIRGWQLGSNAVTTATLNAMLWESLMVAGPRSYNKSDEKGLLC
jgi:hypothetical protein